ncbi:MAG: type II secretion system secretin GspD [Candidatus Thiodiazotropha sp. (ex. Lucinoma kazani)]
MTEKLMRKRQFKLLNLLLPMALTLLLASCAQQPEVNQKAASRVISPYPAERPPITMPGNSEQEELVLSQQVSKEPEFFVREGSGQFLKPSGQTDSESSQPARGDITLNFEGVDLREVVKVIFEEILRENYLIDEKVQGKVTIHTTYPVSTDSVLPILENILQMNGAAMVRNGSHYKILPAGELKGITLNPEVGQGKSKMRAGQGVQIVPLKYISAVEMKKILESFTTSADQIRIDPGRNLMILTGSFQKINNLLQTIKMFDVDWLSGMSFGLIPLKFTDAKTITDELKHIIGDGDSSPLAGMIKLIPVERLNAVMVISQQPKYINEARRMIAQFDQGSDKSPDRRLYVHHLKNGKAENIAAILQSVFGNDVASPVSAGNLSSDPLLRSNVRSAATSGIDLKTSNADREAALTKEQPAAQTRATNSSAASREAASSASASSTTIIADPDNNAILVMATPKDYQKIKATITRLDVAPKQVLIEATIAEVKLSDNLSYGVRWFFRGTTGGGRPYNGALGKLPDSFSGGDGFSLGLFNSASDLRVFFDILESESSVKLLSAPQIMVVDNQTASFRVGDQIPIVTRASQSSSDSNAPLVSEIQFRDTGTLLQVTPRINEGGMVTLEVSQEVSTPGSSPAVGGGGNVSIAQRTIESTVIVHDGQTVVLGGLIREDRSGGKVGIPGLMHIPLLGNLFSSTTKDVSRTELIVTLTPKVVHNPQEAYDISQELREKIRDATLFHDDFQRRRASNQ